MQEQTTRATAYGDVALVGVAVFVALALVMATVGSPALSDTTPTAAGGESAPTDTSEPDAATDAGGPHDEAHGPASSHGHDDTGPTQDAAPEVAGQHGPGPESDRDAGHDTGHGADHGAGHDSPPGTATTTAAHDEHDEAPSDSHGDSGDGEHEGHAAGHDDTEHTEHDDAEHTEHDGAGHDADEHDADEHDEHDAGDDHEDHDDGGHDHANMYAGCDDDHPETRRLVTEVQHSLEHLYPDPAMLIAQGYIPYFDTQIPGALATEGIGHWLNPGYIDNGVEMDPTRPESILTDEWYRPIGVMFIENNDGEEPRPVYVDEETGEACSPWHPHTDMPARIGWWYYRQLHDGAAYRDGEVTPDEVTPAMMHLWVDNPNGVYAAHDYPPAENRQGFPPPRPGYDTPATPLDGEVPDPEDPESYPFDASDTCPHCPEGQGGDGEGGEHDEGHDDHSEDNEGGEGHDDHAEDGDGDGHDHANMYAGCDEDHPESVALREAVTHSLSTMYTDVATLVAKGYVPYPDIILPGITHWLKPPEIYDERVMDPQAPEAVLTDAWHRPVGIMFVEHPDEPAPPVYVNDDGTECYPWHPHTDAPAVFAWNGAELVYQQNPEYEDVTPAMMHVWVDNPHGMYAAHDYPPPSDPPGPLPSYLADTSVQDTVDEAFGHEESDPIFEVLYELFARIEEGVLEFNGEPPELPTD